MPALFTNRTTNGSSSAVIWQGGQATVYVRGTFDSATVTLEVSFDNGTTWVALDSGLFTTATAVNLNLSSRVLLRATVANAGAATSISVGY